MAARFPQSGSAVAYQIKAAWASKIHAIWWAAGADSVHQLKSGDTATTILTRSASGATFNSTDGRIAGDNASTYFVATEAGGWGGLAENDNFSFGASYYGDVYNEVVNHVCIGSKVPWDTFADGMALAYVGGSAAYWVNTSGFSYYGGVQNDNVAGWMVRCVRNDQADGTAKQRFWINGAEITGQRLNATPSSTTDIANLYIGGTDTDTGNSYTEFEAAWFGGVLTDAEMDAITADPSVVIEEAVAVSYKTTNIGMSVTNQSSVASAMTHHSRRFG